MTSLNPVIYMLGQVWPKVIGPIQINVLEIAKQYPKPFGLKLRRSSSKKINYLPYEKNIPDPYVIFHLKKEEINKKVKPNL